MERIEFTVHGTPAAQGSKNPWGGESNPNLRPWRAAVAAEAAELMSNYGLIDGPVRVEAEFVYPRPKSHFRTGSKSHLLRDDAPSFKTSKPDLDKLQRAIGDALTGVVFRDDSQIASWRVSKVYGESAHLNVRIYGLGA